MSCPSNTKPKLVSIAAGIFVILAFLFAGAYTASAQSTGECMVERYNATKPANVTSLNCTSNDVQLAAFEINLVRRAGECPDGVARIESCRQRLSTDATAGADDKDMRRLISDPTRRVPRLLRSTHLCLLRYLL